MGTEKPMTLPNKKITSVSLLEQHSCFFYFNEGFTPCKAEYLLKGMELEEKDPGAFHGKISLGVIFEITEIVYKSIFKA